jgi:uridylate kinase
MKPIEREKLVIKLGGSLISVEDGRIDTDYVRSFAEFIRKLSKDVLAIFIVVGGGQIVRHYQNTARDLGVQNGDDLDSIGLRLTRVNAELIRAAIGRDLAGEIIYTGGEFRWFSHVVVGAGWGHAVTSDYNAVMATDMIGTDELIRLSNIDHIYTDNPTKNPEAKAIADITWEELTQINIEEGNSQFRPGMNVPLDPRAVMLAEKVNLKMAFLHGKKFDEITNYLLGEKFEGTYVHPKK